MPDTGVETKPGDVDAAKDLSSLSGHFKSMHRIEPVQTEEGLKYRVVVPAAYPIVGKDFSIAGGAGLTVDTWAEAKARFLEAFEDTSYPKPKPILSLHLSDTKQIRFSEFSKFNPEPVPSKEPEAVPPELREQLGDLDHVAQSAYNYCNSLEHEGWENDLFAFVEDYLSKEGSDLKKQLDIKSLNSLTPKQAASLALQIVLRCSEYYDSRTLCPAGKLSKSDRMTALELLEDGRKNKGKPDWHGNGVCRNFAATVKGVFDSLKANQGEYSQLHNAYCKYERETGHSESSYKPGRGRNPFGMRETASVGHAWNMFVTVTKTGVETSIVDATWADRNTPTLSKAKNLDHTWTRMSPHVRRIAKDLDPESPLYQSQMALICGYFTDRINQLKDAKTKFDVNERKAFATWALDLVRDEKHADCQWPEGFAQALISTWQHDMDASIDRVEMDALFELYKATPWTSFDPLLRSYLADKEITNGGMVNRLLFDDEDLQKHVLNVLKERPDFKDKVKSSTDLYMRLLALEPAVQGQLSPETDIKDAQVVSSLVQSNQSLARFRHRMRSFEPLNEGLYQKIIDACHAQLEQIDPDAYNADYADIKDFYILYHFQRFQNDLKLQKARAQEKTTEDNPENSPN